MRKVQLVTDSTCDLSEDLIQKRDIDLVPLNVNSDDESYQDNVDLTTEEMYDKVKEKGKVPKTSAAAPALFEEVFRKHLDEGKAVVFTGIGSKFSATLQTALIAKNAIGSEDIHLVDSENLSSGTGLLLLKAAKHRDQGLEAKEVVDNVSGLTSKVRTRFVIDTLEYLHKGGRLKAISRFVGSMLRIKPIIKVVDGEMAIGKKARGNIGVGHQAHAKRCIGGQGANG